MSVKENILNLLQVKYSIPSDKDIQTLNYMEEGYIDSLGVIKFICDMEDQFNIEFSDDEIMSDEFQIVGKLITLIEKKMK